MRSNSQVERKRLPLIMRLLIGLCTLKVLYQLQMVNDEKAWSLFNERSYEFQIMNEIQRAKVITKILDNLYPKIKVPLKVEMFLSLISVLLSAQCTDVNVNNVTKNIYTKYYKPSHFKNLEEKKLKN